MLDQEEEKQPEKASDNFLIRSLFLFPGKVEVSIHYSLISSYALLVFRILAFLVLSFRYWLELSSMRSFFITYEFLTELGMHLTWLYFSLVCTDYLLNQISSKKHSEKLKEWTSLLYEIAWCIQFPVTIIFWNILYDPNYPYTDYQMIKQIGIHGFPLFCLTVDFIMSVYQFPKRHLLVVLLVGIFYIAVNFTYSKLTVPVYSQIDWVSTMSHVWVLSCIGIVIVVYCLSLLLWRLLKKQRVTVITQRQSSQQEVLISSIQ